MIKVAKFGGSSLANSEQFKKIKKIIFEDQTRKIIVVSAPGKQNKDDHKITDLLYLIYAHLKYGVDANNIFDIVKSRYVEIKTTLALDIDLEKEFAILKANLNQKISEEFLVSRGEYFCAKLLAEYIGYTFVDAKNLIYFDYNGKLDEQKTKDALINQFIKTKTIVIPGFYGSYPDGNIHLFSRGGSDVTGAVVAKALSAGLYENWTDVSGFLVADPKIVSHPKKIKEISYEELFGTLNWPYVNGTYMGAHVLHEETIFPVQELEIPISIKNTNRPDDEGTIISSNCQDSSQIITGITGKKSYESITIIKKPKVPKIKVMRDVLAVLDKYHLDVEHIPSSIDTFSLIIEANDLVKKNYEVLADIKKIDAVQDVIIDTDIALIAVVGRNMATKPGISAKIFAIFGQNDINIKVIAQASQELSIIVGVSNHQFEKAIRAMYDCLVLQ